MVSLFTEFHYTLKDIPKFDIGKEGFSIKQIYDHYCLKHAKSPIHQMNDKLFMAQLDKCAKTRDEYEALWMKTKKYSDVMSKLYEKQNAPAKVEAPAAPKATEASKAPAEKK